jgi:hypothetical protein
VVGGYLVWCVQRVGWIEHISVGFRAWSFLVCFLSQANPTSTRKHCIDSVKSKGLGVDGHGLLISIEISLRVSSTINPTYLTIIIKILFFPSWREKRK